MNSLHLDEERLLRFADGELTGSQAQRVRSHLESCWECRSELDQLERTVADCVRYRKALRSALPAPPAPWKDIYREMAKADAELQPRRTWFAFPTWQWAPLAAALALVAVFAYRNRELPTVSAAELLDKAVTASESRPKAKTRKIQIRAAGRRMSNPADLQTLEALFVQASYDFDQPLSARAFREWHNRLPEKQDSISTQPDAYLIRTSTSASVLTDATMRLRTADLEPVESTFLFRNRDRVEITELPASEIPSDRPTVSSRRPAVEPIAEAPAAPAVPTPATAADELRVFQALRRLNADLGDPIEITNTGDAIVVTAYGPDAGRRQQLAAELASLPKVKLQVPELGAAPASAPVQQNLTRAAGTSPLETQLVQYFGGRAAVDRFADQTLESTDAVMARAHAIRRLSEHFPANVRATLSPEDRQSLANLFAAHAQVLAANARNLDRLAAPVLQSLGAANTPVAPTSGDAASVFQNARTVEQLLAAVLTGARSDVPSAQLPDQLRAALARLTISADSFAQSPPQ